LASRGKDEVCAGTGEGARAGLSDTGTGAGDDGGFSVKLVAHAKGFICGASIECFGKQFNRRWTQMNADSNCDEAGE
jgi:hypothetical protein